MPKMTEFTREGISDHAQRGEGRPDAGHLRRRGLDAGTDHPGVYKRAGTNHWASYRWDPDGRGPEGSRATSSRIDHQLRRGPVRLDPSALPETC